MGVQLERVQFKFASIIGELCNDPLVLSQFAVWLDLRLAEYKLKGCISLDCSGESLKPPWMKGVMPFPAVQKPEIHAGEIKTIRTGLINTSSNSSFSPPRMHPQSNLSKTAQRITSPERISHSQTSNIWHRHDSETEESRIPSPDVVVVKEEPDEQSASSIFPISLHRNDNDQKRKSTDSYTHGSGKAFSPQHSSSSALKIRRMTPHSASASASQSPASNQSNAGTDMIINPSTNITLSDDVESDISFIQAIEQQQTSGDYSVLDTSTAMEPSSSLNTSWLGQVIAERDDTSTTGDQDASHSLVAKKTGKSWPKDEFEGRKCDICGIVFTRKWSYQAHYQTKHTQSGSLFRCACGKSYLWRPSYHRHSRSCPYAQRI